MALQRNRDSLPEKKRKDNGQRKGKVVELKKGGLLTDHHIIPLSREGRDDDSNKSRILDYFHKRYHWLFTEMTPNEILSFLESYFWNGNEGIIDNYSKNRRRL